MEYYDDEIASASGSKEQVARQDSNEVGPASPEFQHKFSPGPQDCEDLEQYCEGGYHPVLIGDTFQTGRYTVIHKLGNGGGATVWLAQDSEEDRYVALKIIQARDSIPESKELKTHAFMQAQLPIDKQDMIVALHDHFWLDGPNGRHLCLVFEVAGPSLASFRRWDQWRKIRPDVVRKLGLQAVQGLMALHEAKIVYGDLSAGNILFRLADISHWTSDDVYTEFGHPQPWDNLYANGEPVNEPGVPAFVYEPITFHDCNPDLIRPDIAFIDFAESHEFETPRQAHVSAYTPPYAAPEVLIWKEDHDQFSDVWALACILFEMRTGEVLFEQDWGGDSAVESAIIDTLGSLPRSWVRKLQELDGAAPGHALDDDEDEVENEDEASGGQALNEEEKAQDEAEDAPILSKPKKRFSLLKRVWLSLLDSIRDTWKHVLNAFDPENLNPWAEEADLQMTEAAVVMTTEVVALPVMTPPVVTPGIMAPKIEETATYWIPQGLFDRIQGIGNLSQWDYMSVDERVERARAYYISLGDEDKAADTDALRAEVDTGSPPVGPLSEDETYDFANLLRIMLEYSKTERASLEDVAKHMWFTTPTVDLWEELGDESPWFVPYQPSSHGPPIEKAEDVEMADEE